MERPLLLPLLSIIAGLCLAALASCYLSFIPLIPLSALAGAALFLKSRAPFMSALCLLFLFWGNLAIQPYLKKEFPSHHITRYVSENPLIVEGVIDSRPEATEDGCRMYVRTEKICSRDGYVPVTGRLLLYVGEGKVPLLTGDRVRFSSRLRVPHNYGLPGEYDYVRHLAFRQVHVTAYVNERDDVLLMRQAVDFPLQRSIDRLAAAVGMVIDAAGPPVEATVLRALLLGDQGGVPRTLNDAYARSGVNHILSISGFHVGIISLVVFQLLFLVASRSRFLLIHCNLRRVMLLVTLPVMVFYLFLTGAAPATVRSVIMLAVFCIALALERDTDPLDSLMLAALLILVLTPPALFDISFQLSFLALWGLIVLTPLFMVRSAGIKEGLWRKSVLCIAASAAATVATLLPVAYYFHRVSLTGLLANLFIVPLMGYGAVLAGFAAIPLVWLSPLIAGWMFTAAAFLVWLSNHLIAIFARVPVITSLQPGKTELLLFFVAALALTFIGPGWKRTLCCGSATVLCAVLLVSAPFRDRGRLIVSVLSVGQGESILVRLPDGRTMLVDGGGSSLGEGKSAGARKVGERLLVPALLSSGVRRIDVLVLSHPHPDHLQGLISVVEHFPIGEYWEGDPGQSEEYDHLTRLLAERRVTVRKLCAGVSLGLGESVIETVSPGETMGNESARDEAVNDRSLVFRLIVGKFSMLFTGDIGLAAEPALLAHPELLRCTVFKVPHHGSRFSTSDSLLQAAAPSVAVISAGYRNSFHLPAPVTVQKLSRHGIPVWRTDEQGTITISCNGDGSNCFIESLNRQFN